MSVVTGALGSLSGKLLQLLHEEYKLQTGVRKQVQWLHSELESIHAFLRKVSDVPWDRLDEQVKVWAREVRDASYDMEDVLDTFLVRVDGGEPADPSRLKRAMKKMGKVFVKAKARRSISGAIQDIKKHLEEVAERRQKYKLDEILSKPQATTSGIDPRLTAMYKQVTQLIGIDKSRDELISMLNPSHLDDDAPDKKITKKVSVVGVGGLGKTTLAKAVYDNLKSHYDCGAFVSVGRDHDLAKVFKDILFDLDKKKYEHIHNTGRGVEFLIRELQEFLENKRYFVVIDDVWEVKTWGIIKLALVENSCRSKVITTTRKLDVAKEAGEVYKLKPLTNDDSIKLFYTRICGEEGNYLNHPDDVSDKILMKCGGIPLAIITLASLLVGKPMFEWSEVLNSIGFGCKDNREVEDTMTILSFSYYDLPPHLRTCLLYLSSYLEDYFIEKDPLIWKWIAEGFINGKQGTRLFELGEKYFNDLINRSLIEVVQNEPDGRVFACRVHDMVLDLMRDLSCEENFVAILCDNVEGTPVPSSARWLACQNRTVQRINSKATGTGIPKVRSYTTFRCYINNPVEFLRFELLRVVDIVGCIFKEGCNLDHLGDLLHLRYLRIKCNHVGHKLPNQISNLKLLQTLHVSAVLPASIVQLTELLHLYGHTNVPDGFGRLVCLEELVAGGWCDLPEGFLMELGNLRELRVLNLYMVDGMDESMLRDFGESLSNLKKIQHLSVCGLYFEADTAIWEAVGFVLPRPLRYLHWPTITLSKFPSCINPSRLPNLSHLTLNVTYMDEQDLKRLARLPALTYLNLTTLSTLTACNINAADGFFHKLRYFSTNQIVQFEHPNEEDASVSLHIGNTVDAMPFSSRKSNCSKVVPSDGVMPNLEILQFKYFNLGDLKDNNGDIGNIGLEYLPSLREVRGAFYCNDVSAEVADPAWEALRNECKVHRNHPTLNMNKWGKPLNQLKDNNVSEEEEEDEKQHKEAEVASQTADVDVIKLSLASS